MSESKSARGLNTGGSLRPGQAGDEPKGAVHPEQDDTPIEPAAQDVVIDKRRAGWFWIDDSIVAEYGAQIGAIGVAVYACLAMMADKDRQDCFPKQQTIAHLLGLSRPTVNAAIKRLVGAGLIAVHQRFRPELGGLTSHGYTLLAPGTSGVRVPPKKRRAVKQIDSDVKQIDSVVSSRLTANVKQIDSINQNQVNHNQSNQRESARPPAHPAVLAYTETFGIKPNAAQAAEIAAKVTDLARWREVLKDWRLNSWNPKSVGNMLGRYGGDREAGPALEEPRYRFVEVIGSDGKLVARKVPVTGEWRVDNREPNEIFGRVESRGAGRPEVPAEVRSGGGVEQ